MSESNNPSHDFENPPVVEVALRVQFNEIVGFNGIKIGKLWQKHYINQFPRTEEHPALEKMEERFGSSGRLREFRLQMGPPPLRYWFLNNDTTELLQVQRDTFAHNWRKRDKDIPYPRYDAIKQTFAQNLSQLERFINDEGLGNVVPTQCEVTYVNELIAGQGWADHSDLSLITPFIGGASGEFLPPPENGQFELRFLMHNDNDPDPCGRLYVKMAPLYKQNSHSPVYVMTLTARGAPIGQGVDGVRAFIDLGHNWIVRGFPDVTTPKMHSTWRRKS